MTIYDIATAKLLESQTAHTGQVTSICWFEGDNGIFFSSGIDSMTYVYNSKESRYGILTTFRLPLR